MTYFPTCLLRKALSLAVQGDMMLSDGEMYCLFLDFDLAPGAWEAVLRIRSFLRSLLGHL